MGLIPEATIQEIRDRADIVGLIGRYVDLKQAGRNWKGLCPFHEEKTPSFNVNPDRQIFHCFGCQAGGNAITFLVKFENLTFPEAVRSLAADLGVEIPETAGSSKNDRGESERIFAALEVAQRCYREALYAPSGKGALAYLHGRGLADETIERFGLGFAPAAWDTLSRALEGAKIPARVGSAAGLLSERKSGGHYDRLRGRVTFPIFDVRGRVIAFGGRALEADQEPKYLNTTESPVYHKRQAFYGFPQALEPIRKAGRAVICEGYFDAIALCRAGVGEAIATCGTALTPDHARDLLRRTKQINLLFDGDRAGQQAMERALATVLPTGLRVRAVVLPAGQDPDDYLGENGAEALKSLVDRAPDALEIVIRSAMAAGCTTPAEKADAVRHVAPLIASIPNPVERSEYARRLAIATGTEQQAVDAVVRSSAKGESIGRDHAASQQIAAPRRETAEDRHLRLVAQIFSRHPGYATDELSNRLHEVLPESPWKELIFKLIDAGADGCVDAHGAIDLEQMNERLSTDEQKMFHEVLVDESLLDSETPASEILVHLLARYLAKDLEAKEQELKRRMQDPGEDPMELLRERQALLERKRSAAGIAMGSAQ